jgi:glycerol uptake facilitator-like aquaporin
LTVTDTATGSVRALAADFIGTFALIFIGAGAAIALGIEITYDGDRNHRLIKAQSGITRAGGLGRHRLPALAGRVTSTALAAQ